MANHNHVRSAGKGRYLRPIIATAALLLGCSLTPHAIAIGDAVMEWNQLALAATVTAGQGPLPQSRGMAIVQVAVHDAVNGITNKHDTYLPYGPAPAGASPEAAAIAAAHRALSTLFPSQASTLNPARAASLAARNLTEANPGIGWGEQVANAILAARLNDGASQAQFTYAAAGAGSPGVWVPVGTAAALLPGWGNLTPWVLHNDSQFHPEGPPPLQSARYARDYREVQEMGSLTSTKRTPLQTEIARFWLATPSAI